MLTMFDGSTRSWRPRSQTRSGSISRPRRSTVIPRSVRISEAPSYGQTVLTYQPELRGSHLVPQGRTGDRLPRGKEETE